MKGLIFDLDGVLVSTDEYHYLAWKRIADEEGIPFDRETNNLLRGVSRMASLEILLRPSKRVYSQEEKDALAAKKNAFYVQSIDENLSPTDVLPGALDVLKAAKEKGYKVAIGSSSKNTKLILRKTGLFESFDAIADGTEITHSKPDPEVFLLAAKKLGLEPKDCFVIEDAEAGIEAAKKGGMLAVGVHGAALSPLCDKPLKELVDLIDLL